MLKKTDQQLVLALQRDGRTSFAELASQLSITPLTVARRVRYLLESGLISIRAVPNPTKMGLVANALIAIRVDRSKIDQICKSLVDNFYVNLVQTVFGRFDILIIVYFPTWEMLHRFINKELSLMDGVVQIETHYVREMKKRYERVFKHFSNDEDAVDLKENDWKIIMELVRDGRINAKELANKLGLHISVISKKISSLVKSGVIKISAIPNPGKFGFTGNAFIVMTVNATKVAKICDELNGCPEVHLMILMIDRSELVIGVQTLNNVLLYDFIKNRLSQINHIQNTETLIWAEIKKRYYGWFLEEKEILNISADQSNKEKKWPKSRRKKH